MNVNEFFFHTAITILQKNDLFLSSASFCVSLSPAPPPSFPQKVFLKRGGEKGPKLFPLF